jgi:DHA1 family tetracycline resistance protein-like MFS transporter
MGVVMTILAVGNGLMRPPNLGMISQVTPAEDQGLVMGVANSLASLGRILGPLIGGFFYEKIAPNSVFFFASTLAFMAFGILILIRKKIKLSPERSEI